MASLCWGPGWGPETSLGAVFLSVKLEKAPEWQGEKEEGGARVPSPTTRGATHPSVCVSSSAGALLSSKVRCRGWAGGIGVLAMPTSAA